MRENNHFCQTCILPEGFLDITLDQKGKCDFCREPSHRNPNWSKKQITRHTKERYLKNWYETIKEIQQLGNNQRYNCILGYSGGKDSTALLDMLINDLKLKPLAITINNGHLTDVARENIQKTLLSLDYSSHHLFIEEAVPTFNKLFKYLFSNHNSNKKLITGVVCDHCCDLIHSILTKEALKRKIPLIILGYSPDQIKRYFYEMPIEEIKYNWYPTFINGIPFTNRDRQFYINPDEIKSEKMPRILLPYHVLDYNEEHIIKDVHNKGLIETGKADPVLTNCHVGKASIFYDFYRFGGLSYALQYAELVRQESDEKDKKATRKKWLRLYKNVAKAIINGTFDKKGIEDFFKQIEFSKEELLEKIRYLVDQDPNKELIIKNINFFK